MSAEPSAVRVADPTALPYRPLPLVEVVPAAGSVDVLAVAVAPGTDGPVVVAPADVARAPIADDLVEALIAAERVTGKAGQVALAPQPGGPLLMLVGIGKADVAGWRSAGANAARRARDRGTVALVGIDTPEAAAAFAEGWLLGSYTYRYSPTAETPTPADLHLVAPVDADDAARAALAAAAERAVTIARAVWIVRDMVNTPPREANPEWMAEAASTLGAAAGLDVEIWDESRLAAEGFGGILGVGQGSPRPPRMIRLTYTPAGEPVAGPHVVLVGKGITFDSGGLSIKPAAGMVTMKSDMAGAGAVLGAMTTLAALDARVRVTGLLCCAENLPSGTAQRPGDVITQYDGTTVEVINTDAEGRLVLADGIGYAVANLAPDVIVDIATLTGAITVALGRGIGGLFASDDDLAAQLAASADRGGDPVWHMPVVDEYRVMLDSPVADFANVGTSTSTWVPMPRSINASVFLKHFARGVPWAHLDVAGPARNDADRPDCPKGGTGFGVRLFVDWLTGLGR